MTTNTQANIIGTIELELAFSEGVYFNQDLLDLDDLIIATSTNEYPYYKFYSPNVLDYSIMTNEAKTANTLHMVVSLSSNVDINADNFAKKINLRDMLGNTHTCEILNVKVDWDIDSLEE